jgi:hypothetical protein
MVRRGKDVSMRRSVQGMNVMMNMKNWEGGVHGKKHEDVFHGKKREGSVHGMKRGVGVHDKKSTGS